MFSKLIKIKLIENDMTAKELSEKLGTSQQNLSAKMVRDNFSEKEMVSIADIMGYTLKIDFIPKS